MAIHPTALIDADVSLGEHVEVGPYTIIGPRVHIGAHTVIGPHALIESDTTIGCNCHIFNGVSMGTVPQDLKFSGEYTTLIVGDNTTIREFCTLNRGTTDKMKTTVGSNCLLMAYVHVAHDCVVGDNAILANAVQLGGHVVIGNYAIVGGGVPVHQFTHIGAHAIIGGGYRAVQDVPPFIKVAGEPLRYMGINSLGLKRRGFDDAVIMKLKKAYRYLFRIGLRKEHALEKMGAEFKDCTEVHEIISFIQQSSRGLI